MRALFVAAVAIIVGAYGFWMHQKAAPFLDQPELQLQPSSFILKRTGPLREVDLGYAKMSVPATIDGKLVRYDGTLFVSFASDGKARSILICAPFHESHEALSEFRASSQQVFGGTATWHDAQRRAASTRAPSFARFLFWGPEARDAALLAIKSLVLSGAVDVRIYDGARVGAIIIRQSNTVIVEIFERRRGIYQTFVLQPEDCDVDETVSALVSTYHVTTDATAEEQFRTLLENSGIPSKPATLAAETQQTEEDRWRVVADEVRQKRASRTQR